MDRQLANNRSIDETMLTGRYTPTLGKAPLNRSPSPKTRLSHDIEQQRGHQTDNEHGMWKSSSSLRRAKAPVKRDSQGAGLGTFYSHEMDSELDVNGTR